MIDQKDINATVSQVNDFTALLTRRIFDNYDTKIELKDNFSKTHEEPIESVEINKSIFLEPRVESRKKRLENLIKYKTDVQERDEQTEIITSNAIDNIDDFFVYDVEVQNDDNKTFEQNIIYGSEVEQKLFKALDVVRNNTFLSTFKLNEFTLENQELFFVFLNDLKVLRCYADMKLRRDEIKNPALISQRLEYNKQTNDKQILDKQNNSFSIKAFRNDNDNDLKSEKDQKQFGGKYDRYEEQRFQTFKDLFKEVSQSFDYKSPTFVQDIDKCCQLLERLTIANKYIRE